VVHGVDRSLIRTPVCQQNFQRAGAVIGGYIPD
jgi:hypothetical protein